MEPAQETEVEETVPEAPEVVEPAEQVEEAAEAAYPAEEVPERSWAYRILKRHFFSDFGAYENAVDPLAAETVRR